MKRLAVLSGAGVSKESGINTFRDSGGLWEQYPVEDVASIEGWHRNPGLVLDFGHHPEHRQSARESRLHRHHPPARGDYQGPRRALTSAGIRHRLQRHSSRGQGQQGRAAPSAHRLVRRTGAND